MLNSGQSTAVLGSTLIHNNNNDEEITCKLIIPKGMSANNLTCTVQQKEPFPMELAVISIGLTLAVIGAILIYVFKGGEG